MDCVLAQLFDGEDGIPFPPLPDDLDDLIGEDLMQIMAAVAQHDACPRPASSGDAAGSTGASACHSGGSSPALAASPPLGSAAAGLVPRLVTTCLGASACCGAAGGAAAMYEAFARSSGFTGTSGQASGSHGGTFSGADSSDSDDMDDALDAGCEARKGAGSKRKAPDVDWRAIADPSERRRQRRLAKNRVTAARSRERKKSQWSEMEAKLQGVENENLQLRAMLEQFARENSSLKHQLLSLTRGCSGSGAAGPTAMGASGLNTLGGASTEPAVLILIATLLVLSCLLPGDKALALLASALPVLLAAHLLRAHGRAGLRGKHMADALMRMLHSLCALVSRSGRPAQRTMQRLLYGRAGIVGADVLGKLAGVPAKSWLPAGLGSGSGLGGTAASSRARRMAAAAYQYYPQPWACGMSPSHSMDEVSSAYPAGDVKIKPEPVF